jgi:hypothetical protein
MTLIHSGSCRSASSRGSAAALSSPPGSRRASPVPETDLQRQQHRTDRSGWGWQGVATCCGAEVRGACVEHPQHWRQPLLLQPHLFGRLSTRGARREASPATNSPHARAASASAADRLARNAPSTKECTCAHGSSHAAAHCVGRREQCGTHPWWACQALQNMACQAVLYPPGPPLRMRSPPAAAPASGPPGLALRQRAPQRMTADRPQ